MTAKKPKFRPTRSDPKGREEPEFAGAITALATPMRGGQVDHASLKELVDLQINEGIDGLVPCGTTGEAPTLSLQERAQVIKAVVEQTRRRVPVIAGTGANCTATTIDNCKMAQEAGADALLVVTPYYNKPPQEGLVAHFSAVADASDLPVVVYNVPSRTGCDILPVTMAVLAQNPRIVGIKEATGSVARGQEVLAACPEGFSVLSGDDATALALTAVGGQGVISVISNLAPGAVSRMIAMARANDIAGARQIHYQLQPLMELLFVASNPIPVKAALSLMGYTDNELRPPLVPLEGEELERLEAELKLQGLLR